MWTLWGQVLCCVIFTGNEGFRGVFSNSATVSAGRTKPAQPTWMFFLAVTSLLPQYILLVCVESPAFCCILAKSETVITAGGNIDGVNRWLLLNEIKLQ